MDASRWRSIEDLFAQLVEHPPEEREIRIGKLRGDDEELAAELSNLLNGFQSGADFLETPIIGAPTADGSFRQPERIGPYKVIRPIRHGGMGSVYLAKRDDAVYDKQVAIKLILAGADNESILRRFRRERQILASLDHPNIARLLDGGATEDGLPYLVMEYIEGRPLTQWAEEKGLSAGERLKLFRSVCAAVHYAHQRLVIHLDLKPANILVTAEGEPKLLDFGIARLVASKASPEAGDTASLHRPLTPDYASPEQIRGEHTTIMSDVYSLGVVLFELLTGERPRKLGNLTPAQLLEAADCAPPSLGDAKPRNLEGKGALRARRAFSAELDNIVAMAMRADPQRRYASAVALSEDIERCLLGFPVVARPDTVAYRARKFLSRNRAGVAAALLVCASLVAGMTAATWEARVAAGQRARAQRDEQRAERRLDNALKLTHSLLFEYHDSIAGLSGSTPVRMQMVHETLAYLNDIERDASDSPGVRHQIALAYLKMGDVQGRPYSANLGDTAGALSSYQHAADILVPIAAAHPGDPSVAVDLASAYDSLGRLKTRLLDYAAAQDDLSKALKIGQRVADANPDDERNRTVVASTWQAIGNVCEYRGDLKGAFAAAAQAESIWHSLAADHPSSLAARQGWAASLELVGAVHEALGGILADSLHDAIDAQETRRAALNSYQASLNIARSLVAQDPANVSYLRMEADLNVYTARMLIFLHQPQAALRLLRTGVSIFFDLSVADPANREMQFDSIDAQCQMASLLAERGEIASAMMLLQKSVTRGERLLRADPDDQEWRVYIGNKYWVFENTLAEAGALPQALRIGEAHLAFDRESINLHPEEPRWRESLANDMLRQAQLLIQVGEPAAARKLSAQALAMEEGRLFGGKTTAEDLEAYGHALLDCATTDLRNRRAALVLLERAVAQGPASLSAESDLARAYAVNGLREKGLAVLSQILAGMPLPQEARNQAAVDRDLDFLAEDDH